MRAPAGSKMHSPASWNRPVLKPLTARPPGKSRSCRQPRIDDGPGECPGCTIETWTACPLSSVPSSCRRSGARTPNPSFLSAGCCMPRDTAIGCKGSIPRSTLKKILKDHPDAHLPGGKLPGRPDIVFSARPRSSLSTAVSGTFTTAPPANTRRRRTRNSGRPSAPQRRNGTNAPSLSFETSAGIHWSCGNAISGTRKSSWTACRGSCGPVSEHRSGPA